MARDEQGRKSGRNFASLRATFSRSSLAVNDGQSKEDVKKQPVEEVKPLPKTKLPERRQSKYTLFDLFSKPKVQTARGYHEAGLQAVPEQPLPEKPLPVIEERQIRIEEKPVPRPPRKPAPPPLQTVQISKPAQPRIEPPPVLEYWDAPPLFQAYPQSIRHGVLQSPAVSMDTLVRTQNLRKQAGLPVSNAQLPSVRENGDGETALDTSKLQSRRFSSINETPELSDKIFVLVTAGRLVQYSGDGNYDRMPEKVLQLGEKSAAFACDLIPGKHWVVQVVQHMNADVGSQINKSRSILSRLRSPAVSRKSTANVLLVFNSAEDMDDWLKAIRGVIEKLGGAKKKEDGEARALEKKTLGSVPEEQLSHRYRVSRPTSMISTTNSTHRPRSISSFSQPRSPRSPVEMDHPPVPSSTHLSPHITPANSPREVSFPAEVRSLAGRTTSSSPLDSSAASSDHIQLERLREGSRTSEISMRTSHTSDTDHGTIPTSKCSSSPPSPHLESFAEELSISSDKPMRASYIAVNSNVRRLSIQPISPIEITQIETIGRIPQPSQEQATPRSPDVVVPKPVEAYPINLENARSRASEVVTNTMPVKLRLTEMATRRNSEMMGSWNRGSRPDSVVGQLPSISTRPMGRRDSESKPRRPLSRMLPIRPSDPNAMPPQRPVGPGPAFYGRRFSSLPTMETNSEIPEIPPRSASIANPSTAPVLSNSPDLISKSSTPDQFTRQPPAPTHRARMPSLPLAINSQPSPPQQSAQQTRALRRPTSLQIRSDPAPFLSKRRPSITSPPSQPVAPQNSYFAGAMPMNDFLPGSGPKRTASVEFRTASMPASMPVSMPATMPAVKPVVPHAPPEVLAAPAPTPAPTTTPPIPPMNPNRSAVRTRTSMASMMLPPPAPPPNMPLPSLPPNLSFPSRPPNIPLPALPASLPVPLLNKRFPSQPPNIPLPPIPTHGVAL